MKIAVLENLEDRVFFKQPKEQDHVSYACVLGLVLARAKKAINMMPQDLDDQMRRERACCRWRRLGLYAIGILFIFSALMINSMVDRLDHVNNAVSELNVLFPWENAYNGMQQQALIKRDVLKNTDTLQAMHVIYESTPVSIFLISLNSSENGEMVLHGFSASVDMVFEYVNVLRQKPVFKNVRLDYTDAKNKGEIKFNIICVLKN